MDVLQVIWYVLVAFAGLGFLCVFVERHVELRKELDTEYGFEQGRQDGPEDQEKLGAELTIKCTTVPI